MHIPAFQIIKDVVIKLYAEETQILDVLATMIQKDAICQGALQRIRTALKKTNSVKWIAVRNHYKIDLVRSVLPDGTFPNGGDRRSDTFRSVKKHDVKPPVDETLHDHKNSWCFGKDNYTKRRATPVLPKPPSDNNLPWLCLRCQKAGLDKTAAHTPSYSNVAAKRAHRRWAIAGVAAHTTRHPAVLYLDDELPFENNASGGS